MLTSTLEGLFWVGVTCALVIQAKLPLPTHPKQAGELAT